MINYMLLQVASQMAISLSVGVR